MQYFTAPAPREEVYADSEKSTVEAPFRSAYHKQGPGRFYGIYSKCFSAFRVPGCEHKEILRLDDMITKGRGKCQIILRVGMHKLY
ncbi:hypothetical protein CDAR_290661 [Caerostris darwini]|uniref:Uncharacterized protein n=1 Tax=Caerostris darwini TaxID=1538125 RepID=A0AAV4SXW6_9ARAC|nr:hypothetical protein CDAR_290661 [Caerostris darwini]